MVEKCVESSGWDEDMRQVVTEAEIAASTAANMYIIMGSFEDLKWQGERLGEAWGQPWSLDCP